MRNWRSVCVCVCSPPGTLQEIPFHVQWNLPENEWFIISLPESHMWLAGSFQQVYFIWKSQNKSSTFVDLLINGRSLLAEEETESINSKRPRKITFNIYWYNTRNTSFRLECAIYSWCKFDFILNLQCLLPQIKIEFSTKQFI